MIARFALKLPLQVLHRLVLAQLILAEVSLPTMGTLERFALVTALVYPERAAIGEGARTVRAAVVFDVEVDFEMLLERVPAAIDVFAVDALY